MYFKFAKIDSPFFSCYKMVDETPPHLFYSCTKTKLPRDQLKEFIPNTT